MADDVLPPDPGKAGKVTLEGIDTDSDGVRDDLQIAIAKRHKEEDKRAALTQLAVSVQKAILAGNENDQAKIQEALLAIDKASNCLFARFSNPVDEGEFLQFIAINTDERGIAHAQFSTKLSGQIFDDSDYPSDGCEQPPKQ